MNPAPLLAGGVATYGFLRGLLDTLHAAREQQRPWVYMDRGYFGASYGLDYSGYFRVTRDDWQYSGASSTDAARWKALNLDLLPWRRNGEHIVVCPPGDVFTAAVGGFNAAAWLSSVLKALHQSTDRPIVVRPKTQAGVKPLAADLVGAHALVTYMSNTAVEAIVAGVPVFCTGRCAASVMGLSNVLEIEHPVYPEREGWAYALANNQWTLQELSEGKANHLFQ